jgi:endoglucanase
MVNMKKLLTILMALMLMVGTAMAADPVAKAWDANTESDLAGYYIYRTTSAGSYVFGGESSPNWVATINCAPNEGLPCTTHTDIDLSWETQYFWVCTAFDTANQESGASNEITWTTEPEWQNNPPSSPSGLRLTVQ